MFTENILKIINNRLPGEKQTIPSANAVSVERLNLHSWWLTKLLNDAGVSIIAADGIPMKQLLQNFSEISLDMVILFTDGHSGINLLTSMMRKITKIRSIVPNVGILIASTNSENYFNPNLLPARVWLITPSTMPCEIENYLSEIRYALNNNSFLFRNFFRISQSHGQEIQSNKCFTEWVLPNFNIKHPAMLLSIANVALKNRTPVFVEISPQEALVYYDYVGYGGDVYKRFNNVFRTLKADVDWVKRQTGAQIFLHLDHCNDTEIIKCALDCGFNSVMADGSNQTLSTNIRFVQSIKKIAEAYNVPVEGEVGAIDLSGFRKKSTTICSELDIFVEATNADYVGVNIRQFHGCDYGFDRAREAHLKHMELKEKQSYQALNLLQSCIETDGLLEESGYSENSNERIILKALMNKIVFAKENALYSIMSSFMSSTFLSVDRWINEINKKWIIKQKNMLDENKRFIEDIIGFGIKENTSGEKSLDFELLASIVKSLEGTNTNIVLHGGSSIISNDLRYLDSYGIKRVNFGSNPYRLFVNSLRSEAIGDINYKNNLLSNNPLEVSYYINKYASNWKNWLNNRPQFLFDFEYELENQFFRPILNRSIA